MIYNNSCTWSAAQRKNFDYFYIERHFYETRQLNAKLNKITTSLKPIGPTLLVEWGDE